MKLDVVFSGVGGQGVVVLSDIYCEAAMRDGFDVAKAEIHGMAQRGGAIVAFARIGTKVESPLIETGKADAVVGFEILDLNFGCPVRKITGPGAGAALLQHPEIAEKIFENVMTHVKKIPVTIKMRTGFTDPSGKEALCIARLAEFHGLSAVTVHGRTRAQGYSGKADSAH